MINKFFINIIIFNINLLNKLYFIFLKILNKKIDLK